MTEKVIIMGAAGRDFHNFNVYFRDNERYEVVCFTATQIPDIEGGVTRLNWPGNCTRKAFRFIRMNGCGKSCWRTALIWSCSRIRISGMKR